MKGITITQIKPVSDGDPRGQTYELFKGLSGAQVTFYRRTAGNTFGNHFHKGLDLSKDPEYFFLIEGQAQFDARNGRTGETVSHIVNPHEMIVIEKDIFHSFTALTDVVFIEYRSTVFDPSNPDCFYGQEEYDAYIKH